MNASGNSQTEIPDDAEICERKVTISNGFHLLEQLWVFHTSTYEILMCWYNKLITQSTFSKRDLIRNISQNQKCNLVQPFLAKA